MPRQANFQRHVGIAEMHREGVSASMVKRRTRRNRLLSSLSTASRYLATAAVSTEKFLSTTVTSRLNLGNLTSSPFDPHPFKQLGLPQGSPPASPGSGQRRGKARRETTYVVATAASSRSAVIAAYLAGVHGPPA
jgi:hypothetical protein